MSKPPRTDVVTVFIMNDGRYVKEHEFDRLKAELDAAWAKVEELNKDYAAFSAKTEVVCVEYANKIAEKDKLIEQMREALENIRDYPGHIDYTTGEVHSMQEIAIAALAAERGE